SRFVRFVLEEDVYGHLALERGIPYAISTMLHYVILLIGSFLALVALGIDLTKVTLLAGAFTVGIGFGLQNVINNFVSGLILLFERPMAGFETDSRRADFLRSFGLARLPKNSIICRRAGEMLLAQHRPDLALTAIDKALLADPTDPPAQLLRLKVLDAMLR